MLKDIQEAIESLEARIEAEEKQIRLMKNDLRALKERLPQGTEITGAKSLPESLDELFRQFFIQNDTRGLIKRVDTVLARNNISIDDLYNISFMKLSSLSCASGHVVSIIIAVLEHYGIEIEIPEYKSSNKSKMIAKQVKELLPGYRERIIFK